jgi:hypothetical protein
MFRRVERSISNTRGGYRKFSDSMCYFPKPQVNMQVDSRGWIYATAWKGPPKAFSMARQQYEYRNPRYQYRVRWKVRVQRHSDAFSAARSHLLYPCRWVNINLLGISLIAPRM